MSATRHSTAQRRAAGQPPAAPERIAGRIVAASAERVGNSVVVRLTALRGGICETDLFCVTPLDALGVASTLQMAVAKDQKSEVRSRRSGVSA